MSKKVQCVPGGHQISIEYAYWCNVCQYYFCGDHAGGGFTTFKCPKGHQPTKAR
jgi:hypothetical protein